MEQYEVTGYTSSLRGYIMLVIGTKSGIMILRNQNQIWCVKHTVGEYILVVFVFVVGSDYHTPSVARSPLVEGQLSPCCARVVVIAPGIALRHIP